MSQKQTLSNTSHKKGVSLELQPTQAWMAIQGLVLFTVLFTLVGLGSILRLLFPIAAFAVGVFLYRRYPVLYIGFTWWVWFLTPLLRRLIDFRSGWDQQGLILLAPYLVTLVTCATFFRHLPRSYRLGGLPFVLAGTGVFYGFLVGVIKASPTVAARSLLDWLTPILLGFHFLVNWRDYPNYRQNIQRTFLWGVLITGVYGIVQYLVAPGWDRFWLINSGLTSSAGQPQPFGFRVWSTLHAPGQLAVFLMAALLLLFNSKGALRLPATVAGYLAFLLTSVRAAWGGWIVGLLTLIASLKPRLQMRLIITILVMTMCILPLTTIDPFAKVINSRFQSFSNLENDQSLNDRSANYNRNLSLAFSNGLGNGIGSTFIVNDKGQLEMVALDSGILDIFFTLGWFGAVPYVAGILLVLFHLFQGSENQFDPFISTVRAILIGVLALLSFFSAMLGFFGMFFWGFAGLGMAARKYYQHQRITGFTNS